jgi:hypothetical protein
MMDLAYQSVEKPGVTSEKSAKAVSAITNEQRFESAKEARIMQQNEEPY